MKVYFLLKGFRGEHKSQLHDGEISTSKKKLSAALPIVI